MVYIDESGDQGLGIGSEWFLLAAVIVRPREAASLGAALTDLKRKRGKPLDYVFHWNKETPASRQELADVIAGQSFTLVESIWHCYDPKISSVWSPNILYYSAAVDLAVNIGYVIRRIHGGNYNLNFYFEEAGGGIRNGILDFLIRHARLPKDSVRSVRTSKKQERLLLQAADAAGGAFYNALPRAKGQVTDSYAMQLAGHVPTGNPVLRHAISFHPVSRRGDLRSLMAKLPT